MQQRVREPYRGINPSSARQLPILAALHAGFPTLFASIIHEKEEKVNTQFANIGIILSNNFPAKTVVRFWLRTGADSWVFPWGRG